MVRETIRNTDISEELRKMAEDRGIEVADEMNEIIVNSGEGVNKDDTPVHDPVASPSHYTYYNDIEVIQLTEQMVSNRGNAVKYIARAGLKSQDSEQEDLEKAIWYLQRELKRINNHPRKVRMF